MSAPRVRARLTREGVVWVALTAALAVAAWISANNLLFLLLAVQSGVWLAETALGPWNLRHLQVRRELPPEVFADAPARGAFVIHNRRRWLPSSTLHIEEVGSEASAALDRLPAGDEAPAPARWRFAGRGPAFLSGVRVSSTFPFGLVRRTQEHRVSAELLVYPRPSPSEPRVDGGREGPEGDDPAGRGVIGDIDDIRPYRDGDPPQRIHAALSARTHEPMIVLRTNEIANRVEVVVRDRHGRAWEHELARATGEVTRAFHRGCRVGLLLPDTRFEPRSGSAWRRTLLEALARQPDRGP
jgi:uncharacterized protein (DUF58 family)